MAMFNPFLSATIEQLVKSGKNLEMSHAKVHIKTSYVNPEGQKVIINYSSLLDKYYVFLQKIIVDITFTDEEYAKYKFQPKRFCMDHYGTTELWSSILRINNLTSASQFTNQTIRAFTNDIFDVLNEIMILEDETLKNNKLDVYGK